ncbi:hypothetical protein BJF89_17050 [Corynebacterium sp. CNJ-954]|uniref:hypothetical protein n=1 Tax=Corynebacterium sp. CNJ-954 TaxID=1904962 RepID=UPI000962FA7A|nr:hypothetical protein [Corynebacterium sp. CNJ-954]OLT54282.1 hypothetical protein BJF89_17050 [Corynebacterium sp. CNJ-954]
MGDFITQEEFNQWCPDSLAPITHEVTFLKTPIDLIEEHYSNWLRQWAEDVQDEMYVQFNRQQVTADLSWVDARREDLPGLLLPQNIIRDRHLFCETDSPWTAVFTSNSLPGTAVLPMMQSFIQYVNEEQGSSGESEISYIEIHAKPRAHPREELDIIADSYFSPQEHFSSIGNCHICIKDNVRISRGVYHGLDFILGHHEHARDGATHPARSKDGFRFLKPENYDDIEIDSEDFISELPDSFDDIEEEPIVGPDIWNIFGFREMEMICADFGIRPFDKDFYSDRGLLATMWFENEPRFTAVPRVDFKHYQRMIGVGPDIIRSR